jgi:Protein of unknown function (DUF3565)
LERAIVGFDQDEVGDWVALLECGHRQHVRHQPPFRERPWVLTPEGRAGRIGSPLDCGVCDEGMAGDQGGDPACLAHEVCPECGSVVAADGHRPGCRAASP